MSFLCQQLNETAKTMTGFKQMLHHLNYPICQNFRQLQIVCCWHCPSCLSLTFSSWWADGWGDWTKRSFVLFFCLYCKSINRLQMWRWAVVKCDPIYHVVGRSCRMRMLTEQRQYLHACWTGLLWCRHTSWVREARGVKIVGLLSRCAFRGMQAHIQDLWEVEPRV